MAWLCACVCAAASAGDPNGGRSGMCQVRPILGHNYSPPTPCISSLIGHSSPPPPPPAPASREEEEQGATRRIARQGKVSGPSRRQLNPSPTLLSPREKLYSFSYVASGPSAGTVQKLNVHLPCKLEQNFPKGGENSFQSYVHSFYWDVTTLFLRLASPRAQLLNLSPLFADRFSFCTQNTK